LPATVLKVVPKLVPTVVAASMIATAMSAAMTRRRSSSRQSADVYCLTPLLGTPTRSECDPNLEP
jgi:hypothetical protein